MRVIEIESTEFKCVRNGDTVFEADLVLVAEALLTITGEDEKKRPLHVCIKEFQDWLSQWHNAVGLSHSETLVLMHKISRDYRVWNEQLKKNLGDGSNSHGTSEIFPPSTSATIESE